MSRFPIPRLGEWDRSVISPPTTDPIAVGDELWFYYTGRNGLHSTRWVPEDSPKLLAGVSPFRGALGLATIKKDRFVAMEGNYRPGILRTKPIVHDGGTLTVSLLDDQGNSLQKTTIRERDSTDIAVPELTKIPGRKGQPMRLEFAVQNGRLFSFWVQ